MDELEVDVAVVGGGACGAMTALRAAADPDLLVGVFEKSTREGCNAEISSGSLAAGGTRFQREAGIEDSPELHAREILAASGDLANSEVVHALCAAAPEYVEWLADELEYPMEIAGDLPRAGMSVTRLHTDTGRSGGRPLIQHLRAALEERDNVAFVDEAPAIRLTHRDGAVDGVVVAQNGGELRVRAETVVLALDGFAGNPALMKEHCAHLGDPFYGGVSTSTGDALPWLNEVGAELRHLGACLRSGLVVVGHGTRVSPSLPFFGAVLVDLEGRRFVDEEAQGYSKLAGILQTLRGQRASMVWDDEAHAATRDSEMMRETTRAGGYRTHTDERSLAEALGLPEATVRAALQPHPGRRPLRAPYHHAWVTHGVLTTQGGAVIDTVGRVLRPDGTPVRGLRAGGGTAVGLAGPESDGYVSGNGLLSAFGMGWLIGNDLAGR
ncbi:FAD-dependent oxidoreductase [Nocardioides sp. cx-169]|uniref:FAD-dependent oxidoreductase n=1 Tax=Nocardioides sp. cx-169 TaxID=2899080 RepID=UPI001E5585A2|nr:FAD-binding protein [Nocardioides sp. cx-169]MCD4534339.1 FAD-dependent oxidoreductase [Nocardioides sp. cx-169]